MDIKFKNKYINIIALVLSIFLLSTSMIAGVECWNNRRYLNTNPYFHSNEFINELNNFFNNLKSYTTTYKDYDKKTDDEKINQDELTQLKQNYDNIVQQKVDEVKAKYETQVNQINNNAINPSQQLTKEEIDRKINNLKQQENNEVEQVNKENTKSIEDIKKELVDRNIKDYNNIKNQLQAKGAIKYYIKDGTNNETYTNIVDLDNIDNYLKTKALYSISFPRNLFGESNLTYINSYFSSKGMEGYLIVPKESEGFSYIHANYKYYNSVRNRVAFELLLCLLTLAAGAAVLTYTKRKTFEGFGYFNKLQAIFNKIPFDLSILIFLIYCPYAKNIIDRSGGLIIRPPGADQIKPFLVIGIYMLFWFVFFHEVLPLIKDKSKIKDKFQNSLFTKIINFTGEHLKSNGIFYNIIVFFILSALYGAFLFLLCAAFWGSAAPIIAFLFIVYCVYVLVYLINKISYLDKIIKGTDEIASGNLNFAIVEKGKGNLSRLSHNINNLEIGIKKSMEEQMKSDRLKSELITNVSHDLKTPLTSIINYVNLLKQENLSKEEVDGYVTVLDKKTERLKLLIEDLFEASKMASGAVDLNIEKIDTAQLLRQSLAELDEKIKNSSLTFRVNIPNSKVYANLDGKKTWRIFENLIGNILKYSQPNSRVYIDLAEDFNNIVITMKNISSYEMNFDVDEIFERFKRGDSSRNTEGSGLGLAIAKSIAELQGGSLNIEIDGDLFKATVKFIKII
ncbi:sensor histidine kinase [Candidatus Clostridium stratigraminis]|uniref:histidine kinase n=1 Tax=Candidatus Clostridium stratigraminis TaxID=3381661 RepID=A0ABW8T130_9CLOT